MTEANNDHAAYPDENPLVFYSNPGQLQELACVATIASVWYRQMKTNRSDITPDNLQIIDVDCSDFAQLPTVLEQMAKEFIPKVQTSFNNWLYFHRRFISLYHNKAATVLNIMGYISWRAAGTISFEQTAKKLIKSDLLSDTEKYKIACVYCFVDDIKKLRPIRTTTKDDHPMIRYWNYRMRDLQFTVSVHPECSSIEASLLKSCSCANTLSAFEYLWGFLTDEEQVPMVEHISNVNIFCRDLFLKEALCKLNEHQLEQAVISSADSIFHLMLRRSKDCVIPLWSRVKNIVTNDHFYEIIGGFLWLCSDAVHFRLGGNDVAFEMWNSAPNALKNHILDNHVQEVLGWLFRIAQIEKLYRQSVPDVRFLIELLSSASQANRDTFWKENWESIIFIIRPKCTQQIMKLCLQSDDEIASFKTSHLSSFSQIENHCFRMVNDGDFSTLNEFLQLCSDDPVVVSTYKVSVLKSRKLLERFIGGYDDRTLTELDSFETFVRETFPDTDELNEFRRNLIFGKGSMAYFRKLIQICHFRNLGLLLGHHVMFSMPELSLAKSKFLKVCRDFLILGELESNGYTDDWNKFIKWCLDDDDSAVENFKLSLPVDQIFNAFFKKCKASVKRSTFLENPFDRMKLLEWVFPTQEASQNFKLGKLGAYEDIPQIRSVFKSNDENLIDEVLMWFFNEDEEQVKKFKVSLKRVKFPKMKPRSEIRSLNVSSYRLRPRTRQQRSQEISGAFSCQAKLGKRKNRSQADVSSSYRAKLRKRITASK